MTLKNITDFVTITFESPLLSPDATQYSFTNVPEGRVYTVTVVAVNDFGDSAPSIGIICKYMYMYYCITSIQ